jgi:hypothetical protein
MRAPALAARIIWERMKGLAAAKIIADAWATNRR